MTGMLWGTDTNTGIAAPTATATTSPTTNWQGQTGASGWFDASKWDPNNFMQGVQPLTGLKYVPAREYMARNAGGDMETFTDPAYVLSSNGTRLPATTNADGSISFSDTYDDPGGSSEKNKMDVSYIFDQKTGVAIPKDAASRYQASDWVSNGQPIAQVVAAMAAAYLGGTALAGAGTTGGTAAGAGAAGGSAATGNMALIESGLGTAGYGGSSAGTIAVGDGLGSAAAAGGAGAAGGGGGGAATAGGYTPAAGGAIPEAGAAGEGVVGTGGATGSLDAAQASAINSSSFASAAQAAGQSVLDFAKTPAGQKLALTLAGAVAGAVNSGSAPKPNATGGGAVGDIANQQLTLAQQQAARSAQLQGQSDPLYAQLIQNNVTQAGNLATQSGNQFASYQSDFAPIESKLASTALNYDTPGRREQEAQTAVGDQATRFALARDERNRSLAASGLDPNSGKALALDNAARIEQAKAEAGGANAARKQVENTGLSLIQNAATFGQNKLNTGMGLANASTNIGNSAATLANQQQTTSNNTAQTNSGLLSNASNSLATQANINNGLFNQQQTAYNNKNDQTADWLGAVGQIAGSYFSSKKLKDEVGDVDTEAAAAAVGATPIKAWRYKPGAVDGDDGRVRIGKYAEDSQAVTGMGDGKSLDAVSENGLNQAALSYLVNKEAQRDPKLRKRLAAMSKKGGGLADARRMG